MNKNRDYRIFRGRPVRKMKFPLPALFINLVLSSMLLFLINGAIAQSDGDVDLDEYRGPLRKIEKPGYNEDSPRIELDHPDLLYDFGIIPQQSSKDQLVIIRNVGKSDLIIKQVKPG